MTYYKSNSTK